MMAKDTATATETISADDLRQQFRSLAGEADETAGDLRNKVLVVGTVTLVLVLIVIFLLGRSRGRKATTVLEIVRV